MRIIWSERAFQNFKDIITYLEKNWSDREIRLFVVRFEKYLFIIQRNPNTFPVSSKKKNTRRCVISKQITLYYQVRIGQEEIFLVTIFDSRQDPVRIDIN